MASPERDKPCSLRKMALLERDGVSVWRIEGEQHIRHTNVTTPSIHGFAGTNVSPYEKMATPERDKPRSLQKMALLEREEYFLNVIDKDLTLPIDKILRKRDSG